MKIRTSFRQLAFFCSCRSGGPLHCSPASLPSETVVVGGQGFDCFSSLRIQGSFATHCQRYPCLQLVIGDDGFLLEVHLLGISEWGVT
jgi:hypothetical protein